MNTILTSIIATLVTIVGILGTLKAIPKTQDFIGGVPVFGAINSTITATGTYYRYLDKEPLTKPLVTTWNTCNKIPDIEGGGFTYLTTFKGSPIWSSISCE